VQRRQHVLDTRDPAFAETLEHRLLATPLQLLDQRARGLQHLVRARVLHIHLDAPGEPLLEVLVELGLEVSCHLPRAADDQALERLLLEVAHQRIARVLEVVVLLLLDPALVASLGPAALVVLAEDVVVDLLDLPEALGRAAEDAGVAPVHERNAPALAPLEPGKRSHQRRVADRHLVRHAARQLQRLEYGRGFACENRHPMGAVRGQVVLQEAAGALKRGLEGYAILVREPVLVPEPALSLVHERAHRGLTGWRRRKLRGVQVEVEAQHDRSVEPQFRQTA
jgi:hypothetical protein